MQVRGRSVRIFYMDEGVVCEAGPAKELFAAPRRPKPRAFLRRIEMLEAELKKEEFDLCNFMTRVTAFAEKQLLEAKQINTLHLVLEPVIFSKKRPISIAPPRYAEYN